MSDLVLEKYDTKTKVTFFFHDFKQREANPEGFDSKMKNWMHLLEEHVLNIRDPLVSIDDLRKQLTTFGLKPTFRCLQLVFTNLIRNDEIISESSYYQRFDRSKQTNEGWLGWGKSTVVKLFSWTSSTITTDSPYIETVDETIGEKTNYVFVKAVEKWAQEVFNQVNRLGLANQCLEMSTLEDKLQEKCSFNDNQLEILLLYLQHKNRCVLFKEGLIKLVKFGDHASIDQRDCALFRLRVTKNDILKQIEDTETEIEETLEKAREQVRSGNKFKAKQLLRRKQRLEIFLDKQQKLYDTVEASESKVQQTDSNKMIVDTMNEFADVYKIIQPDLKDVQSLQENMDEIMEKEDKYNEAMGRLSKVNNCQADDAELDRELNEILDENIIEGNLNGSRKGTRLASANQSPETLDLEQRLHRLRQSTTPNQTPSKRLPYGSFFTFFALSDLFKPLLFCSFLLLKKPKLKFWILKTTNNREQVFII